MPNTEWTYLCDGRSDGNRCQTGEQIEKIGQEPEHLLQTAAAKRLAWSLTLLKTLAAAAAAAKRLMSCWSVRTPLLVRGMEYIFATMILLESLAVHRHVHMSHQYSALARFVWADALIYPDVFAPLQQCLKDAAEAVQKEAKKDPVPQFSSKQVKTTTNWLKAAVSAMQEDNLAQEP